MIQNVNLIEEVSVQPVTFLNSRLILNVSFAWIILLFLIYIVGSWIDADRINKVKKLEKMKSSLMGKIAPYEGDSPYKSLNVDLRDIRLGSISQNGFYHYFKSLSELVPPGVWLTEIVLEPDDVVIKGKAIAASGVSFLLNKLKKTEGFKNKKIEVFDLEKVKDSDDKSFTISTIGESKEDIKEKE